ncbi:MAG: N-acetylmuramoyl-L-alanine amidase [Deltaproteobacteria bacterium]|nr:N-acetylmuramoyl-L-alanine amidase [Deltaproteobacteria bacterium]
MKAIAKCNDARSVMKWGLAVLIIALAASTGSSADKKDFIVVVDAGHGGIDQGVRLTKALHEKDLTLSIARMVQERLNGDAVRILLTRSGDDTIGIAERRETVRKSNADLFVSLHVNAGFGMQAGGYEFYILSLNAEPVAGVGSKVIVGDMAKSEIFNKSYRFAQIMQAGIDGIFPRKGRGIRNGPMIALEGLDVPAVLIEMAFATNKEDRERLEELSIRKRLAETIAKSIESFAREYGARK